MWRYNVEIHSTDRKNAKIIKKMGPQIGPYCETDRFRITGS